MAKKKSRRKSKSTSGKKPKKQAPAQAASHAAAQAVSAAPVDTPHAAVSEAPTPAPPPPAPVPPVEQPHAAEEPEMVADVLPQPQPFLKKYSGEIVLSLLVAYVILLVLATISEIFNLGWFRFDWLIR